MSCSSPFSTLVIKHTREHENVSLLPHCFYYGPGLLASAHLLSIMPEPVPLGVPWLAFEQTLHPFIPVTLQTASLLAADYSAL